MLVASEIGNRKKKIQKKLVFISLKRKTLKYPNSKLRTLLEFLSFIENLEFCFFLKIIITIECGFQMVSVVSDSKSLKLALALAFE